MAKCSMCRRSFDKMDTFLVKGKPICDECAGNITNLMESNDREIVESSINYIYTCMNQASDPKVAEELDSILKNNASIIDDLEEEDKRKKAKEPVDLNKMDSYFENEKREKVDNATPGISVLFYIFALIIWVGGIFTAIDISGQMRDGSLWFIIIVIISLVCGSIPMAVAQIIKYLACIAENTGAMRNLMNKKH